jgi:hypothetical protein
MPDVTPTLRRRLTSVTALRRTWGWREQLGPDALRRLLDGWPQPGGCAPVEPAGPLCGTAAGETLVRYPR